MDFFCNNGLCSVKVKRNIGIFFGWIWFYLDIVLGKIVENFFKKFYICVKCNKRSKD